MKFKIYIKSNNENTNTSTLEAFAVPENLEINNPSYQPISSEDFFDNYELMGEWRNSGDILLISCALKNNSNKKPIAYQTQARMRLR